MPRKRRQYPHMRVPRPPNSDRMMKGMVDVSKMAVVGAVGIGTIGMIGSLIKK